ncbi:MAG: type II toxin-antitoxin system VapC family toxin [Spirochaetaceae bacterium]|jgi:predicted nucleic acid-binding protein|nr:type II toxin-antitoxin system VapC family toxin [Spirochaetaceae bacterium]
MNIVDSSCWIEYLMDTEIGGNVAPIVENSGGLLVPTITLYEVYKKLLAEKSEEYALWVVSYMQTGTVIELSSDLSIAAANISRSHKIPMADSIIFATAQSHSAILFSCDKHFKDIPGIRYFHKKTD